MSIQQNLSSLVESFRFGIVRSLLYTLKRVLLKLIGALLVHVTLVNKVDAGEAALSRLVGICAKRRA
jgi:hypothetical protein